MDGAAWQADDGASPATAVARGAHVVHVQRVVRGVRVVAEVRRADGEVADLEARARRTVEAVAGALPDDAVGRLRAE